MNSQIVSTDKYVHNFTQLTDGELFNVSCNCMQINGQANSITEFVNNSGIDEYIPFKYKLLFVYNASNSKNYTAFLYSI